MPISRTKSHAWSTHASILAVLAVSLLVWSGCGSEPSAVTKKFEVADDGPKQPAENNAAENNGAGAIPEESPAVERSQEPANRNKVVNDTFSPQTGEQADKTATTTDPTKVPTKPSSQPPSSTPPAPTAADGPQKLLAHLAKLQNQDPRAATQEETLSNLGKIQREVVNTADQILNSKADEETLLRAAEAKVGALSILAQLKKEAQAELKAFETDLKQSPHKNLVRLSNRLEFAQKMDGFVNGKPTDIPKLMTHFKQLFEADPKDESLFQLSQQVTELFLQSGRTSEASEIMKLIADTFSTHTNAELAKAGKLIGEQVATLDLHQSKFDAVQAGKPQAAEEMLAAVDKIFAEGDPGEMTLQVVSQLTRRLEPYDLDLVEKLYAKLTEGYTQKSKAELVKAVNELATGFAKRKAIIGKPFVVEGVNVDGKPFDWSQYEGKVVLVDFWATWCRPCLEEIPNIKQNYDQYRDQGFEVVGINIDEDRAKVQQFFSFQRLPWPTVLSVDPKQSGFDHPLMVKCGVNAIPFLVLVDRDGNAVSLNPRGESLGKVLAKLFPAGAQAAGDKSTGAKSTGAKSTGEPASDSANPLRKTPAGEK